MVEHYTTERDPAEVHQGTSLGHLRLRHVDTNDIILIPTPSSDPNDPLNWSKPYRIYLALLVCAAMLLCNFLAAGPTVAMVEITYSFTGAVPTDSYFSARVAHVAYFFNNTALLQGMGNLFWMPLIIKYGRRPVYVIAFICYTLTAIWAGFSKTYASEIAARTFMGFFSGAGECLAPLTISDIFFLHERGFFMALYTVSLSAGVSAGIIIDGLVTIAHSWRYIYYIAAALIGGLTILVILTMPETSYIRNIDDDNLATEDKASVGYSKPDTENVETPSELSKQSVTATETRRVPTRTKRGFLGSMRLFTGTYTTESLWRMAYRPVVLLILPPVLWATLIMAVTIGFLVAITSNFATAFSDYYDFASYQSGLCFVSGFVGTLIGILGGGWFSDWVADFFTRRNNGIREPEMRLPAMTVCLICSPLALVLYGCGIEYGWHWIVPTLGLGLLSFAIAQGTNVSLVYTIDSYRPVAGEVVVTQLAFKSAFGFLLSFYTNPWIDEAGYARSFGAMAGISGGVIILWVPLYIWGAQIRRATLKWSVIHNLMQWNKDREVGE